MNNMNNMDKGNLKEFVDGTLQRLAEEVIRYAQENAELRMTISQLEEALEQYEEDEDCGCRFCQGIIRKKLIEELQVEITILRGQVASLMADIAAIRWGDKTITWTSTDSGSVTNPKYSGGTVHHDPVFVVSWDINKMEEKK